MPAGLAITIYLASALVSATLAGAIAPRKRRHAGFWITAGFLLPPTLLILVLLPTSRAPSRPARVRDDSWEADNLDRL